MYIYIYIYTYTYTHTYIHLIIYLFVHLSVAVGSGIPGVRGADGGNTPLIIILLTNR